MRQDRDDGVERSLVEGQRVCVCLQQLRVRRTLACRCELLRGCVDGCHAPAGVLEQTEREPGAAAEIEAAARPWAEEPHDVLAQPNERLRRGELVIPGGVRVVARGRHAWNS